MNRGEIIEVRCYKKCRFKNNDRKSKVLGIYQEICKIAIRIEVMGKH